MSPIFTAEEERAFLEAASGSAPPPDAAISGNGSAAATPDHTWAPVDLADVLTGLQNGTVVGPTPTLMPRTDGACLLYPGEVHSLAGEPEAGKGWLTANESVRVITDGAHVLYLDFEDTAPSIVGRLLALGAHPDAILTRFTYVRPDTPLPPGAIEALHDQHTYTLAVLDGLSEAYVLLGLDPYSNVDAAKFLKAIARPLASHGAAVVLIDHVTKSKETRGRYAIGAQHKLAGIAVAYGVDIIRAPDRQHAGTLKLKVEKDRHGHVRAHATNGVIALAHITPANNGDRVTVTLAAPDSTPDVAEDTFRPTTLMERVSRHVDIDPGATRNQIREAVKGKAAWIDTALRLLIIEGYIEQRPDGQSHRHHTVRLYLADDDEGPTGSPSPNRVPTGSRTQSEEPGPRVPPLRGPGPGTHTAKTHYRVPRTRHEQPARDQRPWLRCQRLSAAGHRARAGHDGGSPSWPLRRSRFPRRCSTSSLIAWLIAWRTE